MNELIDHDGIRNLARECARDALAGTPPGGFTLVCDVAPEYFERLEQRLGRPYSELEASEFRREFDEALEMVDRPPSGARVSPTSLVDVLGDAGVLELVADLAEGPLDVLLELEGIAREVPLVGSVVGGIRAIRAGRDFLLARKISAFLGETGKETTEEERQAFLVRLLASDAKFKDRVVSNLWIMLERLDDIAKAPLLSRAFAGYVRRLYTYEVFLALVAALDRCLISDLTKLPTFAGLSSDYPADSVGRLTGCGLVREAPILDTPGALRGIDPKTGKRHVGSFDVKVESTDLGRTMKNHVVIPRRWHAGQQR